ncbi:hypothetical protein [Herbaspirillum robiniae]|uniref:hypothetical protein n=1 Tax=Herbaspirillum robiniae TaxID=2014887 RepID=UPI001314EAD7|nr:hypothetical protein [Herbaspirillum robiniae]
MNVILTAALVLVAAVVFRGEPSIAELIRQHMQLRVQLYAETHPVTEEEPPAAPAGEY